MKKLYAFIMGAMLGVSAMAQNATTFAFTFKGEVVPNGSTVVVANQAITEIGPVKICDIHSEIQIKNQSSSPSPMTLVCVGKESPEKISCCAKNNCVALSMGAHSDIYDNIAAGEVAEASDWLHASSGPIGAALSFEYKGVVELRAYPTGKESDCAVITVCFDTNGTEGVLGLSSISSDSEVEVFNLCGKKVASSTVDLPMGVYIIRLGNTSRKVTIR